MSTRELWKKGIPLSEAWWEFSSDALFRKYNHPKLSRTIGPKTGAGMAINALAGHPERRKYTKLFVRAYHSMEFSDHRAKVRRDMEIDVLERLQAGALAAYGYLATRSIRAAPIKIPERFFQGEFIKWDFDEITAPPDKFTSVRVLDNPIPSSKCAKRGRPPDRHRVIAAMQSLANENPGIVFKPRKVWADTIRKRMQKLFSSEYDGDRPAERTITRIIPAGEKVIAAAKK